MIMNGQFGEMKKLIEMLLEAKIPFQHIIQYAYTEFTADNIKMYGEAGKYMRNQINYYRADGTRAFDCILQNGSYGCKKGLLESYSELGADEEGNPRVMTAEEAFEIIRKDWDKQSVTHKVKILPQWFNDVATGKKNFELRKNDRDFKVGDELMLQEWENGRYTGRKITKEIEYVYPGNGDYGLDEGYCILGLK